MKELEKNIARTHCFMHQSFFRPNYIFNNDAYFIGFSRTKIPFDLFECKSLFTSTNPAFCGFFIMKTHKVGICKVSGRSVIFSAFYADFFLCTKSVIITYLIAILCNHFTFYIGGSARVVSDFSQTFSVCVLSHKNM